MGNGVSAHCGFGARKPLLGHQSVNRPSLSDVPYLEQYGGSEDKSGAVVPEDLAQSGGDIEAVARGHVECEGRPLHRQGIRSGRSVPG